MDAEEATIADEDRKLLLAHYRFYRGLETGQRVATTAAQSHFIAACRGSAPPQTAHERAYLHFKRAVAAAGVDESTAVAAGFALALPAHPTEELDPSEVVNIPVVRCAACGRPIPPERLQAVLDAIRCVACQRKSEADSRDWQLSELDCPRCASQRIKSRMIWRTARDPAQFSGYFLGCSRFPECRYIDRS
jgi:hypothetical protein